MRIAVWHNLPSGGGLRALHDQLRGLTGLGHTVEIWCPPTADGVYLPLDRFGPVHVVPLDWPVKSKTTDFWQITLPIERSLRAMELHCELCARDINAGGFDILLAGSCQFFATSPISKFMNIPSVLYLQEPNRPLYEAMPTFRWLAPSGRLPSQSFVRRARASFADWRGLRNDRLQARSEVQNGAAFNRILVNSLFSRESVLRAYGLDSEVCYLGVDVERFTCLGQPRENFIVGLGSYNRAKNIRFVIESLGTIPAPKPALVWVGNSAGHVHIAEMAALAQDVAVEFIPMLNVPDSVLVDVLNRAAAMIYAPRLEPFGLAPLEAAACGVPVVAVAEGGVRETVVDGVTGFFVKNDPAEAGAAVMRLLHDPALARQVGANARLNVVRNWSVNSAIANIDRALRDCADLPRSKTDEVRQFARTNS